ncbi:Farnesyl diphosphate synthase [Phytophthora cinnamomi]|uniref:Farnesyl diphosphate synthase n=1 Tax=Phytophthora cinnamomi TaxID=4785 RepID=UPI0035595341|nr:Farnesyl diphosphate synthase [Phytophthora cinnamomi]
MQVFVADGADGARASAAAREVGRLRTGGKPSRKSITLEEFSGLIRPGAFDAGVRRWWRKFQDQLADAQILDGHRWNDPQRRSIFAASLSGNAAGTRKSVPPCPT